MTISSYWLSIQRVTRVFKCLILNVLVCLYFKLQYYIFVVPAKVKKAGTRIVKQRKGASANVNCKASGTPAVQLHWYKSSKRITISPKYEVTNMFTTIGNQAHLNSTLKIQHIARSDNGTYICQVTNSFGGDTEKFHLVVLG